MISSAANQKAEVIAIISELTRNKIKFMTTCFQVQTKDRLIIPFQPMSIQRGILAAIQPNGSRSVIVKPSQVGASTAIIGFFLADTITTPGTTSVIVAYEEFITQRLLNKAQFFYDNIPEQLRPEMDHRSSHEKSFPGINSSFYIGSARAFTFGRGESIFNFLADEYAFWPNAQRIMVPALQRVPAHGRVAVLSTPNGDDNDFYALYSMAKERRSNWRAHFFPWTQHEEYSIPSTSPSCLEADKLSVTNLDDREFKLRELNVSDDQIRWRRYKKAELYDLNRSGESANLLEQEFPEDDISCFLSAGDMVYPPDLISDLSLKCYPAPSSFETCGVWEQPLPSASYVIGCDPGMERQTQTAITVARFWSETDDTTKITRDYGKVVCTKYGLINTDDTAELLKKLGHYYNDAVLVPESNNHGLAVITNLRNYPNLYYRWDMVRDRQTRLPGWQTTPKTKPYMIQQLTNILDYLEIPDIRMVSQFRNIRYLKNLHGEKMIGSTGSDDIYNSLAITVACRSAQTVTRGLVGVSGWGRDRDW